MILFLGNISVLVGMTTDLIVYKDSLYVILIIDFYIIICLTAYIMLNICFLKDSYQAAHCLNVFRNLMHAKLLVVQNDTRILRLFANMSKLCMDLNFTQINDIKVTAIMMVIITIGTIHPGYASQQLQKHLIVYLQ